MPTSTAAVAVTHPPSSHTSIEEVRGSALLSKGKTM